MPCKNQIELRGGYESPDLEVASGQADYMGSGSRQAVFIEAHAGVRFLFISNIL